MNRRVEKNRPKAAAPEPRGKFSLRAWREQHLYSLFSSLGRLVARPWATVLTLAVLSLALALPLLFWLLLDNARDLSGRIEDARALSVFLKADADAAAADQFAQRLRSNAQVGAVVIKSPAQGLEEFRSRAGFADALQVLHYNPLPTLLIVSPRTATTPDAITALAEELRGDPLVDLVQYDLQWRQRLSAILHLAARGAAVFAGLLALAALLVIGNTVRLDIQARAEEIVVMQLLGADDGFVRRPFLYTGLWYGILAGVMSLMLIVTVEAVLAEPLAQLTASYDRRFDVHGLALASMLAALAASTALGWLGAFIAASRHIALGQPK
jgi:cell division transport system permease protein